MVLIVKVVSISIPNNYVVEFVEKLDFLKLEAIKWLVVHLVDLCKRNILNLKQYSFIGIIFIKCIKLYNV